jgi:epidermal growth factor receptor substrate 15
VTYTTSGGISTLSVAIVGSTGTALASALNGDGTGTPITATTLATATKRIPVVYVPSTGTVTEGVAQTEYALADGTGRVAGLGAASNTFRLVATADAANTSTFTTSAGAFVASAAGGAWNAGKTSHVAAQGATVYVFATKTGLHTVTVTSADKTVTIKFLAVNEATDRYTVSVSGSSSINVGENAQLTATVKDVFGNVVAGAAIDFAATGSVLLAGLASSVAAGNTAADGTVKVTVIGNGVAGTGTVTATGDSSGAAAWAANYTPPTGAGNPARSASQTYTVGGGKSPTDIAIEANKTAIAAVSASVTALQSAIASLTASLSASVTALSNRVNKALAKIAKKLGVKL